MAVAITMLNLSSLLLQHNVLPKFQFCDTNSTIFTRKNGKFKLPVILCCSESTITSITEAQAAKTQSPTAPPPPPLRLTRRRYRKLYPGEKNGITEEMRFVAMRLRNNSKPKRRRRIRTSTSNSGSESDIFDDDERENYDSDGDDNEVSFSDANDDGDKETWQPSMEGFVKCLVDSKLVFDFIERIVDESSDVSYAYFRKTGLERSKGLSKDLEWCTQQDIVIPEPSNPGVAYVNYLEELAEKSPPLFLCHFYNIYFSHIAGGQVIGKQVSEKLLEGKELEFYSWDGESEELLRGVREKLNMLGEHWTRDEKNKCLRETTKSFRFLGQIVRLIIL